MNIMKVLGISTPVWLFSMALSYYNASVLGGQIVLWTVFAFFFVYAGIVAGAMHLIEQTSQKSKVVPA